MKTCFLVSSVVAAIALPAFADGKNAIPDLSGVWGRSVFNFEPTGAMSPQPLRNLRRVGPDASKPVEVGDPVPLVGDYMNPILRPEAAAVVKQRGEMSASGHDFPDPPISVPPSRRRTCSPFSSACSCCSARTTSSFFTIIISRCAMCA